MSEQDIDRVIRTRDLQRFTKNTLTDQRRLMEDLKTVVIPEYVNENETPQSKN